MNIIIRQETEKDHELTEKVVEKAYPPATRFSVKLQRLFPPTYPA